jgi:hypothetical protein
MKQPEHAIALAREMGLIVNFDARGRRVDSEALARGVDRGTHLRLVPGVFVEATAWNAREPIIQFRMRAVATALTMSPDVVFSHFTAATFLGIPVLGEAPTRVEVTVAQAKGGRSSGNVRRHCTPLDDEVVDLGGFLVTSPARTVADIARSESFTRAVATADAALHHKRKPVPLLTLDELAAAVDRHQNRKGAAKLRRVAEFATPLSDSVRESESRCLIHLAGFPAPVLQQEWRDDAGLIGFSDFWWPEHGLIGEYDGKVKYVKAEYLMGRTLSEVIEAEKHREDRMRALGPRVTRWATSQLTLARLTRQLVSAGLPLIHAPRRG